MKLEFMQRPYAARLLMRIRIFGIPLLTALLMCGASTAATPVATKDVLVLAASPGEPAKLARFKQLAAEYDLDLDYQFVDGKDPEVIGELLNDYRMIMLDYVWPIQIANITDAVGPYLQNHKGIVFPGSLYKRAKWVRGLTPDQARTLFDYYDNGGIENHKRMFNYIGNALLGITPTVAAAPIILPESGIYHPDSDQKVFATLDDYLAWRGAPKDAPLVGIGFHRKSMEDAITGHIDELARKLDTSGVVAVPFFFPVDGDMSQVAYKTAPSGEKAPAFDVAITFRAVFVGAQARHRELEALDIVMINAIADNSINIDDWYNDDQGLANFRVGTWLVTTEIAGYADPIFLAAQGPNDELQAIPEQVDALVERVQNYIKLRRKPNAEKQVAFLVWNSPEGEDNFSASYLNVPASLVKIFASMRNEGYLIDDIGEQQLIDHLKLMIKPYYRTDTSFSLRKLLAENLAEKVPVSDYEKWFSTLPESIRTEMATAWPDIKDNYLTVVEGLETFYVIPRLQLGNIVVMPQPLRGNRRESESDAAHDKKLPVHHAYRALYYSIVQRQPVDAIVHVGTHGTQEWLSGKERAQWVGDDTQTTVGNIPVIYPYNVASVGEGLIAKRRGRAVVISHNTPPFAPAGLYGEVSELHEIMHSLGELEEGRVKENTKAQLVTKYLELGFEKDLQMDEKSIWADWDQFFTKLHGFVEGLASAVQPLGLHTFGVAAQPEHVISTVMQMLGTDYLQAVDPENGEHVLIEEYESLQQTKAFVTLRQYLIEEKPLETFDAGIHAHLQQAQQYWDNFHADQEIESFLSALNARFVPTGNGNDPLRNPDAIPTGRNTYAFDPAKVPTKAAWDAGVELADTLIENYRTSKGDIPDKLSFTLWSTETFKHYGVIESEIMYLLGVRPVWNRFQQIEDVEIIPLEELGRPRIDALMSMSGLYRDNLSQVMNLLQKAVNAVAELDEDNNFVRRNALITRQQLIEKGMSAADADMFARVRLFGTESGQYGTDLPEMTLESGEWEDDRELADVYLQRMGYMYGNEDRTHSLKLADYDLYAENLRGVKGAVLSRSSNTQGVLSIDHPFEYLGGISLAVRSLTGESPELFIADLRNTRKFSNQTVGEFLSGELRSRYYHPRWIGEMQSEGYSGANQISDMVNNFWGWNVMDRTTVREDQWNELFEIYVQDKLGLNMEQFFKNANPAALAQITERMLEANRKEYWDASDEVVKELIETYIDLITNYDLDTRNEKFKEYVATKAAGFGIEMPQSMAEALEQAGITETVQGMSLEEVQPQDIENIVRWWLFLFIAIFILAGAGYEWRLSSRSRSMHN